MFFNLKSEFSHRLPKAYYTILIEGWLHQIIYTVVHCVARVHRKDMQSTVMSGYSNPDYSRRKILCISMFAELQLQTRELHGVVLWHPHFIRRSTISGTSSTSSGRVTG